MTAARPPRSDGFRERGDRVTCLETFVDAAFAFAFAIIGAYSRLPAGADLVVVEGGGGWLAPISDTATMAVIARRHIALRQVPSPQAARRA